MTTKTTPRPIIGTRTRYHGTEHPYLRGCRVRIVAVLKADGAYLENDLDIARAGGVTAADRIEVQPWLPKGKRFSFVTSDPKAADLACFAQKTN